MCIGQHIFNQSISIPLNEIFIQYQCPREKLKIIIFWLTTVPFNRDTEFNIGPKHPCKKLSIFWNMKVKDISKGSWDLYH